MEKLTRGDVKFSDGPPITVERLKGQEGGGVPNIKGTKYT